MKLERFKAPDTALLLFCMLVGAAGLAWLIPPGQFERASIQVPGAGLREVAVAGTFRYLERPERTLSEDLLHTIGSIFQAPIKGFTDPDAALIIAFVLFIGGTFGVLQETGAVNAALRRLVHRSRRSPLLQTSLIPAAMLVFSLGGAIFGMAEETIPFVLIFIPLARALGYDTLTGAAIPFVGAAAGFAAAFFNPFTVGVAQGIAGLPPFSGAGFRVVLWLVTTSLCIGFVARHAARVRREPHLSPTYESDQEKRDVDPEIFNSDARLERRHLFVLLLFATGIIALVWGVLPEEKGGRGWYIIEIAALFIALGSLLGLAGGLGPNGTTRSFMEGVRGLAPTAVLIGLARGILVILQEAQTLDTILFALASTLQNAGATGGAIAMFAIQAAINFFVPSGSGQAALTMPLMAPLADLLGITRQTAVLAYQMGDGFTNMIIPTNVVLMSVLSLAGVPWHKWARWILPLQCVLFLAGAAALVMAVLTGYGL